MRSLEQVRSAADAARRFVRGGFSLTPPHIFSDRMAACHACAWWDSGAFGGTGRCHICKCSTQAKLRMATERCPLGKWGAFDTTPPE
jgi:hypothetical protein